MSPNVRDLNNSNMETLLDMIWIINSLDGSGTAMFSCDLPRFISPLKSCSTGMIDILFNVSLFDGKMFLKVSKYLCLTFMVLKCTAVTRVV